MNMAKQRPLIRPSQIAHITPSGLRQQWLVSSLTNILNSPNLMIDQKLYDLLTTALTTFAHRSLPFHWIRSGIETYISNRWGLQVGVSCCPEFDLSKAVFSLIDFVSTGQGGSFVMNHMVETLVWVHHKPKSNPDQERRKWRWHLQHELVDTVKAHWVRRLYRLLGDRVDRLGWVVEHWHRELEECLFE